MFVKMYHGKREREGRVRELPAQRHRGEERIRGCATRTTREPGRAVSTRNYTQLNTHWAELLI